MEKIDFEDIRVGDKIEAHRTYSGGDSSVHRFTVLDKTEYFVNSDSFTFSRGEGTEYFLVERPKPTFKVGDTITGEQVADLPDGAVFDLNECGTDLRYKIDGQVYSARGSIISLATYGDTDGWDLKIVFLPEA